MTSFNVSPTFSSKPFAHRTGRELRRFVAANVPWRAMLNEKADGCQKMDKGKLAAREDRARGYAKLMIAGGTLELATRRQVIGLRATAPRALG